MKVVVLASGSRGNATYIETENMRLLIDAGISLIEIKRRLASQGIAYKQIDAIWITHEHTDHTNYLKTILNQTKATVYINNHTYQAIYERLRPEPTVHKIRFIEAEKKYQLGDITIVPINLSHDAINPFGFLLKNGNASLAYLTDTGYLKPEYLPILQKMQTIIIESNHDVEMLLASSRTWPLKKRIMSNLGHLSNETCRDILSQIVSEYTQYVILAHISSECNCYDLAYDVTLPVLNSNVQLLVAKQDEATIPIQMEAA